MKNQFLLLVLRLNATKANTSPIINAKSKVRGFTVVCLLNETEYPPTGTDVTTILAVSVCAVVLLKSVTCKYT